MFTVINYLLLTGLAAVCMLPFLHVLSISLSSAQEVAAGRVGLYPAKFTWASYETVFGSAGYMKASLVSLERIALGVSLNMLLTVLLAYPLSKESGQFRMRTVYVWLFILPMLFSGGMIPTYMIVKETGLIDSIWALILPNAVPIFNVVLLLNFFRGIPREMEESAKIDGANHFTIMWRIYVPVSMAGLATVFLFAVVAHWNSWFDGMIYLNSPKDYPLQTYLHMSFTVKDFSEMTPEELEHYFKVDDRTGRAAQIFVAALPILLVYPFLQRHFMKGIVLGSVKE